MAIPITVRGKASINDAVAVFDVILYPAQQSMKLSQEWDEEIVKDSSGGDAAWIGRNEKYMGDLSMKLIDTSSTSLAANAASGAAFLSPLAKVTITTCKVAAWNSSFQVVPGGDIGTTNDKVGDIVFKLRRYADATQNTLAGTTPG